MHTKPTDDVSSTSLLLPAYRTYRRIRAAKTLPTRTKTVQTLEERSLSILRAFNVRDAAWPYATYASPDFLYMHETSPGVVVQLGAQEAEHWMRDVSCKNVEHRAEVLSICSEVSEGKGEAVVWLGMRIHDRPDGYMPGTEKVTMFYWRREDGIGNERRWVWYRHTCLSAVPPADN